ncbi:hypothetical protein JOF56_005727 [Kibdelosporangium banguiense]|uniref:Uncharacterized protein n=1 Tax=Kibdelosporangium banguiense TaxID=1365924 RepID=A0ABS4TLN7_9PSEU|nr:hypothetical protein [Kibdelosporangium banguiense]
MDTLDKPAEPTRPEPNAKINKPSKIHNKTNRWIQA